MLCLSCPRNEGSPPEPRDPAGRCSERVPEIALLAGLLGGPIRLLGYGILADVVFFFHLGFILFVALGGLLVALRRDLAWLHVPAALYGAAIEFFGWTCPLTPLEIHLRTKAGELAYGGGFIDEYLRGLVYPAAWTDIHVWLGVAVLVGNALIYWWIWRWR